MHALDRLDSEPENLHSAATGRPQIEGVVMDIDSHNHHGSPCISALEISTPDNVLRTRLEVVRHLHQSCLQGIL